MGKVIPAIVTASILLHAIIALQQQSAGATTSLSRRRAGLYPATWLAARGALVRASSIHLACSLLEHCLRHVGARVVNSLSSLHVRLGSNRHPLCL